MHLLIIMTIMSVQRHTLSCSVQRRRRSSQSSGIEQVFKRNAFTVRQFFIAATVKLITSAKSILAAKVMKKYHVNSIVGIVVYIINFKLISNNRILTIKG